MRKVLVTGGAGYLGSIMVPELLQRGYDVTVVDNFMFKQNSLAHVCSDKNFHILRGDVRDELLMKKLYEKADIVIPLAALVGAPLCDRDPVTATAVNRTVIEKMVNCLSADQWVLMPITNSGYGIGDDGSICTEKSPLKPISLYGKDKVAAEVAVLSRKNSISFRLATVFGMSPRMRLDLLVNDFTYRAFYDRSLVLFEGHFKRNYIHVRDVAGVFTYGIQNFERMKGEAFNVGLSDANLSKKELAEKIKVYLPELVIIDAPIGEDPDKRDYIVSNDKIEAIGFKPSYSLDEGIKELTKGFSMIKNSLYTNI